MPKSYSAFTLDDLKILGLKVSKDPIANHAYINGKFFAYVKIK
jgi:hypothetical protein